MDVYVNLTDEEALRLGNLHNEKVKSLPVSFVNTCQQARKLLFDMLKLKEGVDDPPAKGPANFRNAFLKQIGMDTQVYILHLNSIKCIVFYRAICWYSLEKHVKI